MSKPYVKLLVHFVWATWDRVPLLRPDVITQVHSAIAEKARQLGCHPVHVGGISDHVHLLVGLPTTISIADLVGQIKGNSSHLVNHVLRPDERSFRWQGAYGAFTVGPDDYSVVRDYVNDQASHHAHLTLNDEWEISVDPEPRGGGAL